MSSILSKNGFAILILVVISVCKVSAQSNDPVVKTDKGYIRGIAENGIAVFKGIPYAAPPVGSLRFMPPVEHTEWKDTLSATKFGNIAAQPSGNKVNGNEDCLLLNIYTPKADNRKRAVVVWVHGGSMTNGSGMGMDGHAFADNDDIVTITINYRLGVFGFLYLGDLDKKYAQSGNNGLLDCIMALKWIRQNIVSFGGDPNRVTIMGESAGAKLISAVSVSPQSKGLFQQLIAESGSVQCIRDTVTAKNERLSLLRQMGLNKGDANKLLTISADSLIKTQGKICEGIGGNSFFGPVYDGVTISQDAYQYAGSKAMPSIKALIGTNKYEAAAFISKDYWLNQNDTVILRSLFRDDYPMVYKTYQQALKNSEPYEAVVKVVTQYMYQMHSYRFAKTLADNNIPVWMYRFDYDNGKQYGATHGQELHYIWSNPQLKQVDKDKDWLALNMHNAWVSFIKTGNPGVTTLPQWPNYKSANRQIMIFDTTDQVTRLKEIFDDKSFPSAVFMIK